MFSVYTHLGGGGGLTSSPSHNTSTSPMSFGGGSTPSHNTSTGPMSFLSPLGGGGCPSDWSRVPSLGVPQSQMGVLPARSGWGTIVEVFPVVSIFHSAGYAWTGYAAGGTPLVVSRMRTFLFQRYLACCTECHTVLALN